MGAIVINSPYSGRPVKVREQDIGRAVRDEEGRIFYLVQRSDGSGYYSAMTRKGSPREEEAYDALVAKAQQAKETGAAASARQVHDATGKGRSQIRGKLVILVLALLCALLGFLAWKFMIAPPDEFAPKRSIPVDPQPPAPAPPPEVQEPQGSRPAPGDATARTDQTPDVTGIVHLIQQDAAVGHRAFETPSGLRITIDREAPPNAPFARRRQRVTVNYRGYLLDGTLIADSQRDRFDHFDLTPDSVIPGLVEGITGMAVGERRTLLIPPTLAYGSRGVGTLIPPDATLRYEVELLAVR